MSHCHKCGSEHHERHCPFCEDKNNAAALGYNPCEHKGHQPALPSQIPCVPPPMRGCSTEEQMQNLWRRMNELTGTVNGFLCDGQNLLKNLESNALAIGAYYGPKSVKTSEGYSAEEGSKYHVVQVRRKDSAGRPIRFELHLAYGDTTNSGTVEGAQEASEFELADKLFPAMQVVDAGWFGHVRRKGIPVPSNVDNNYYTVGFTRSGRMKFYHNSTNPSQLSRDQIENSMGVYGVIVNDGQFTDAAYRESIPSQTDKVARVVMGQNFETGDTFVVSTGVFENGEGMTTEGLAKVLIGYGCNVGVEVATDAAAVMLDKGQLLFAPNEYKVPELTAFWYVSKKRHFKNDYQRELAILLQRYGQVAWNLQLLQSSVSDLEDRASDAENRLDNHEDRLSELEQWRTVAEGQIEELYDDVATLSAKLDQEIADRQASDDEFRTDIAEAFNKINQEIADREAAISDLQSKLYAEEAARIEGDAAQQLLIDALREELDQAKLDLTILKNTVQSNYDLFLELTTQLREDVDNLQILYADLQTQMSALDAVVTQIQITINNIEIALNNLKLLNETLTDWLKISEVDAEFETTNLLEVLQKIYAAGGGDISDIENWLTIDAIDALFSSTDLLGALSELSNRITTNTTAITFHDNNNLTLQSQGLSVVEIEAIQGANIGTSISPLGPKYNNAPLYSDLKTCVCLDVVLNGIGSAAISLDEVVNALEGYTHKINMEVLNNANIDNTYNEACGYMMVTFLPVDGSSPIVGVYSVNFTASIGEGVEMLFNTIQSPNVSDGTIGVTFFGSGSYNIPMRGQ